MLLANEAHLVDNRKEKTYRRVSGQGRLVVLSNESHTNYKEVFI